MPIYEYRCKECHQIFEEWTKHVDDAEPHVCPVCGILAERIMSNTSFVLKGGGWYVTDYGCKSKQGSQEAPAPADSSAVPAAVATADSGGAAQ